MVGVKGWWGWGSRGSGGQGVVGVKGRVQGGVGVKRVVGVRGW